MTRQRHILPLLALGVALATLAGCREEPELQPVPPWLIGRWENDSSSHAGRHMTVSAHAIRFGQGGSLSESHSILGVNETTIGGGAIECQVACVDPMGEPYTLALIYDPRRNAGTLRIKTQSSILWRKRAS